MSADFLEWRLGTVSTVLLGFAFGLLVARAFCAQRLTLRASPFLEECNGNVALVLP